MINWIEKDAAFEFSFFFIKMQNNDPTKTLHLLGYEREREQGRL